MLKKSIFRTIKSSLGRYFAILAIIALGIGFFAGLRITEDTMHKTADTYLNELNLYDFRLVSTLGLTKADVDSFNELKGVDKAYGSVSADVIALTTDGSDSVLHAHTLLDGINGIDLQAGRKPEKPNECLVDALYADKDMIGKTIMLSKSNSEDTFDTFAYDEYIVVGLVNASEYINFQRGTTALSNGKASGFIYLLADGFSTDYFTEIYLSLPQSYEIHSEEYENAIDEIKPSVEALLTERADIRFEGIYNDAKAELDDAKATLDKKKIELDDGQKEIDDGWTTYRNEKAQVEKDLADSKAKLDTARTELDKNWTLLETDKKDPSAAIPEVQTQLALQEQVLNAAEEEYKTNYAAYEKGVEEAKTKFAYIENELNDAQKEIDDGWTTYRTEKANVEKELTDSKAKLDTARAELDKNWALLEAAKKDPSAAIPEVQAQLALQEQALNAAEEEYKTNYAAYEKGVEEAKTKFAYIENELNDAQKEIDDGWTTYRTEKANVEKELTDSKAKLDTARAELDKNWALLEAAKKDPFSAIPEVQAQLTLQEQALNAAEEEYKTNYAAYEKGVQKAKTEFVKIEKELNDAQKEIDDAKPEIEKAEKKIANGETDLATLEKPTTYVLDRTTNFGYASFENDIQIVSGVSKVFPLFFFLVAALVCITTMTRMVGEQRTQNGVLKALGYKNIAICSQYLVYAGSASVLGCIIGFLLGSKFMPMVLWEVYHIMYSIDRPAEFIFDTNMFIACLVLYLVCMLGVTYFVCRKDLRTSAAGLMRPVAPSAGKRILLEKIDFIWKPMKFLHKVSVRNIFRYKKRMIMMMIGIGGCTALLIAGFGIRDTIQPIVDNQYGEINLYDATASFLNEPTEEQEIAFRESVKDMTTGVVLVHSGSMDMITKKSTKPVETVAFAEDMTAFVNLHRGKESIVFPKKDEVVINNNLASKMSVSVGDIVTLRDSNYKELTVTVSGIYDNYIGDIVYLSSDTYKDTPKINTAYLNFKDGIDEHKAGADVLNMDNVAAVSIVNDYKETVSSMLDSLNLIVLIVLVCAGALAFIVLYNLTNITITERVREIATLKVLGFHRGEQNSYVFRENIILTIISSIVGIPGGIALLHYTMSQITMDGFYFGVRLAAPSFLWALGLTLLFTIIVDLVLTKKLKKINMAEAMKSIE